MVLAERAPGVESPKIVSLHAETDDDAEVFVLSPEARWISSISQGQGDGSGRLQ